MTRYRVSWSGVARRRFSDARHPSDAIYLLWVHHSGAIAPGLITLDAAGGVTFPARLEAVVHADDMHEAEADFRSRHPDLDIGVDVTVEVLP